MTFKFFSDAGHAWLEVPFGQIKALDIGHLISPYSYERNGKAYLEEDQDTQIFIKAYTRVFGTPLITSIDHGNSSPIRGYQRFNGPYNREAARAFLASDFNRSEVQS